MATPDDTWRGSPDDLNRDGIVSPEEVYPEPRDPALTLPNGPMAYDRLRRLAVDLLIWACAGGDVDETHPRYVQVTEGRDPGPGYSSCADLAHWLYYRLGVRAPWSNRVEHRGWRSGVNVGRLVTAALHYGGLVDHRDTLQKRWAKRTGGDTRAKPGDVIIVANDWPGGRDAHVVCIRAPLPDGGYDTAEYGLPGGGLRTRYRFGRRQRVWLPLLSIIEAAGANGELVELDLPEGFVSTTADTEPPPSGEP